MPADSDTGQPPQPRPTAVAIKGTDGDLVGPPPPGATPRIVAKGQGAVAEQILQLAFATGVKVREDANLTEILEAIEIDTEVPLHALAAVAEILNYVYRANDASADRTPHKP